MAKEGPTSRSLRLLRKEGYLPCVTEHWIPFTRRRKDLFGCIDILALKDGETLAVQCTTSDNMSARIKKMETEELSVAMAAMRKAGWKIVVWGWRKNASKEWVVRQVDLS